MTEKEKLKNLDKILEARMSRCVTVENILWDAVKNKRSIAPRELRELALKLGVPDEVNRKEVSRCDGCDAVLIPCSSWDKLAILEREMKGLRLVMNIARKDLKLDPTTRTCHNVAHDLYEALGDVEDPDYD